MEGAPDFALGIVALSWDAILDIITLICGLVGSIIAFFGGAVVKPPSPTTPSKHNPVKRLLTWLAGTRITTLGWISMCLLVVAFIAGVWSKVDSAAYQDELLRKIGNISTGTGTIITQLLDPANAPIDKQLADLVIRQEVEEIPPKPGEKINKQITFYVDIKKGSSFNKKNLISRITSVIYYFDPRWFSSKPVEVTNRDEDFRYSIVVWGSTRFHVHIVTSDPPRTLLRDGYMDTTKTAIFE